MWTRGLNLQSKPTLVLLGAGATRGASFAADARLKPPVDTDFFRCLSLSPAGRSQHARALLAYVSENHAPNLSTSMEAVFVELQGAAEFYEQLNVGRGRIVREPQRTIEHFYRVVPAVFGNTVTGGCKHHEALARTLEPLDAVISLNYDCVIDSALASAAGRRWNPVESYGLKIGGGAEQWREWGKGGPTATTPIRLLKLHGSLNWDWTPGDEAVSLRPDPYERPSAQHVIVPPLGRKPVAEAPFSWVWREARIRIRSAKRLVVIGYSLPSADYMVRSMLRADLNARTLAELVVVDPDPSVSARFLQLLRFPPRRVLTFSTLGEFAEWLPAPT